MERLATFSDLHQLSEMVFIFCWFWLKNPWFWRWFRRSYILRRSILGAISCAILFSISLKLRDLIYLRYKKGDLRYKKGDLRCKKGRSKKGFTLFYTIYTSKYHNNLVFLVSITQDNPGWTRITQDEPTFFHKIPPFRGFFFYPGLSWVYPGFILGLSWVIAGFCWHVLGKSWEYLGSSWEYLGLFFMASCTDSNGIFYRNGFFCDLH